MSVVGNNTAVQFLCEEASHQSEIVFGRKMLLCPPPMYGSQNASDRGYKYWTTRMNDVYFSGQKTGTCNQKDATLIFFMSPPARHTATVTDITHNTE